MTDKQDEFGSDLEAQDEVLEQEESFETEDWQDELPPEDDFHDHDDFQDDVALEEGDLDSDFEEEELLEDEASSEAAKKRGRNVFLSVMGVVGLAAVGLVYIQISGGSEPAATPPVTSLLSIKEVKKAPVLAAKKDQTDVAPSTDKVDMVSLYQSGKATKEVELPLPGASNKLKVKGDDVVLSTVLAEESRTIIPGKEEPVKPISEPIVEKTPIEKAPVEEVKKAEVPPALPKAADLPPKLDVKPIEAVKVVEPSKPTLEFEKRLADVTAELTSVKDSLDKAMQENASLVSKIETLQTKVVVEPSPALEEKVEALEAKLQAKEDELKALAAKKAAKKVVKKKAKKRVKRKYVAPKKKTPAVRWVLRGATVDSAWISPSSHSKELRRVTVGEVAPTIGMVKEIKLKGEKWLVIGAKGTIK